MAEEQTAEVKTQKTDDDTAKWFALRDLKRVNAHDPAYMMLAREGFEVFTPMRWRVVKRLNKTRKEEVPVVQDLLFVHSTKHLLDPVITNTPTLQYRYVRGGGYKESIIVRDDEMNRFITAVQSSPSLRYYALDEVTADMIGRTVQICGGPLNGFEAPLMKVRGAKKKRIFVELKGFLAASVELTEFDYLQFVE